MEKRRNFMPVDLGNLEDKCEAIMSCFEKADDQDRSKAYREYHLKKARSLTNTLLHDFRYYMDKYEIGGVVAYGLEGNQFEEL